MRTLSVEERRRRLGRRHHLSEPAAAPAAVAGDLVGLHSSDPTTVFLSAWARVNGLRVAEVEKALYDDRSLLRMLGMRRTMFVVPVDMAPELKMACADRYVTAERRRLVGFLEDQLVPGNGSAWLDDVIDRTLDALHRRGEATARELVEDVPELGAKLHFGQGTFGLSTRVLFFLATDLRIIRARPLGSWKSSQYRWTTLDHWLPGALPTIEPEDGRRRLAERWLRTFGPGTLTDLKWWTGWTVATTRAAVEAAGAVAVQLTDGVGFVLPDDLDETEEVGEWVALLPGLDSTVMGWKERDWYLSGYQEQLFDGNGNAGPTVWSNGRVIGGWGQDSEGRVRFELFEPVPGQVLDRIVAEAERLDAWLEGEVVKPRFPTPLERRLRN
ncbi:MAG: winged helix DNA-binding domain-containing protein [Acidimicrobiia bacterium]|nr:winged helix DNA-binding domain-containing protein [Acidimicrobiia bacterium]